MALHQTDKKTLSRPTMVQITDTLLGLEINYNCLLYAKNMATPMEPVPMLPSLLMEAMEWLVICHGAILYQIAEDYGLVSPKLTTIIAN